LWAGTGDAGFGGDGGSAVTAPLNLPQGLALDTVGRLYIADLGNDRVRRVDPDGTIATVAGDGRSDFDGDGGAARDAALRSPSAVLVLDNGDVLVADSFNHRIRRVRRTAPAERGDRDG